MKRKNEQTRRESTKNAITQKHPGASEIFMVVNSDEEAKEVDKLNDIRGKIVKGQLNEALKHKDTVRDKDIPVLRMENDR